jgi:hypothetical protein
LAENGFLTDAEIEKIAAKGREAEVAALKPGPRH